MLKTIIDSKDYPEHCKAAGSYWCGMHHGECEHCMDYKTYMDDLKPRARVLDATASYRSIWKTRESDKVLWIDYNEELDYPPDIIMDCTNTEFDDGRFHTIFFDPPHSWGHTKNTGVHQTPSRKIQKEKWGNTGGYYGFDCYKNKSELMRFVDSAQLEFKRILSDDGILWFKWGEVREKAENVLHLFPDWDIMMKIETIYRGKRSGSRCYWFALMKKSIRSDTKRIKP